MAAAMARRHKTSASSPAVIARAAYPGTRWWRSGTARPGTPVPRLRARSVRARHAAASPVPRLRRHRMTPASGSSERAVPACATGPAHRTRPDRRRQRRPQSRPPLPAQYPQGRGNSMRCLAWLDFLHQPVVAVRVAERQERVVAGSLRVMAGGLALRTEVVHLTHLDAAAGELRPGCIDVVDDQVQAMHRACCVRVPHQGHRAGGSRRCQLHDPEVLTGPVIDIEPETGSLQVEVLGLVYVGNRDNHELELEVHVSILP